MRLLPVLGCRGRVTITVKRGRHTLRKRGVGIRHRTCRFEKRITCTRRQNA